MKLILISFVLGALASSFFMSEVPWLIFVCIVVGRVLFGSSPRTVRAAVVVAGIAVLAAHFAGYKIYGSAIVYDNRPVLQSPHELASLVAPNVILATDGSRFELRGVAFTPKLLALPAGDLQRLLNREFEPVQIQPDAASPSGVVFQNRFHYFCGNTFFPTFLPSRLHGYTRTDLGRYLTMLEYATADPVKRELKQADARTAQP